MKNPAWTRDELILALDLYFKLDYGQMHGANPLVMELSETLRKLKIVKNIVDEKGFRSVGSVALKLANFKKLDQNFTGKGMRAGAKQDLVVWNEFHKHINTLKKEADLIRRFYLQPETERTEAVSRYKADYKSDFVFRYHKSRESDPLMIKLKREVVLMRLKRLNCEICGFDSVAFYGIIGDDLMEVHYHKCLKGELIPEAGSPDDFIVVCSNCHKVLDKHYGLLDVADVKKLIRSK